VVDRIYSNFPFFNLKKVILWWTIILAWLPAQTYPADSILALPSTNVLEKAFITPITWWQRLSYNSDVMNCQFEPSCSNYAAQAISEKGVLAGLVIGTDRIVRCNPAAPYHHMLQGHPQYYWDGRLLDPLDWQPQADSPKSPALAVSLSIIPGLGRAYAGHPWDGFFSFLMVSGFGANAYQFRRHDAPVASTVMGTAALLFWAADFYGAYRTARMANRLP